MKLLAHISYRDQERHEQTLIEHLRNTAELAAADLKAIGFYHVAYLCGLLHDMGKATEKFQTYLEAATRNEEVRRGSVNHTFAGVIYILKNYFEGKKKGYDTITAELTAYVIGAHHGEFDFVDLEGKSGLEHRLLADKEDISYEEAVNNYFEELIEKEEIDRLFHAATQEIADYHKKVVLQYGKKEIPVTYLMGLLVRLILSAVINADRRDTAEFMSGQALPSNHINRDIWKAQLNFLEEKLSGMEQTGEINRIRREISDQCRDASDRGNGIFKLSVPTGAGKTLSTLRYALTLAEKKNKKRILFVIPLLSVLDQNSQVIQDHICDKELILEHHSNVVRDIGAMEKLDDYEMLAETWEPPIVITTMYQMLMTIFSAKTTCIRRMRALTDSIIIFDEAQSLPSKMVYLFNMAMNFLNKYCNAVIVLSSATQPSFDMVDYPMLFANQADMVTNKESFGQIFKRVTVINKITSYGDTVSEIAEFAQGLIETVSSVLIICNTRRSAKELFKQLELLNSSGEYELFHLSTSMCMKHRQDTLALIKECLEPESGRKMICVATQLVEAGVDFSFESVIRMCAGLDSIVQAAGRCNRNGEFGHLCNLYLMKLKGENLDRLPDIKLGQICLDNYLIAYKTNPQAFDNDLLSEEGIRFYYNDLFRSLESAQVFDYNEAGPAGEREKLFELLSSNRKHNERPDYKGTYFFHQAFKTAGQLFQVYDDNMTDIIVPYNAAAKEIIADLCSQKAQYNYDYLKERLHKAKKYTIQIREYEKIKLEELGGLHYDSERHFIALYEQFYHCDTGLENGNYFM